MKLINLATLLSIICASNVFATAQAPDYLIYEGEKHALHTNPLRSFFEKYPEKKPRMTSTANWRGYVATFEITNSILVLKDIVNSTYTKDSSSRDSLKEKLFGSTDDLPIDWFTGTLVIPQGEMENYVHMGYGSTYSHYILMDIKNGKLEQVKNLDSIQYRIFRRRKYSAFKNTTEFKDITDELKNYSPNKDDVFLSSYFAETYTSTPFNEGSHNDICFFEHEVLPMLFLETDGSFFDDLKNGPESRMFELAKEVVGSEFAEALAIQPVPNKEAYAITFPEPLTPPECSYALITKEKNRYSYYTLEKRHDPDGKETTALYQRTRDGKHHFFGTRKYDDLQSFMNDIPNGFAYTINPDEVTVTISKYIDTGYSTVTIPSHSEKLPVTAIGSYAFCGCTNLTNVIIPDSITTIGSHAFYGCTDLTNIIIPNSVANIERYAFGACSSLSSITIPENITNSGLFVFIDCTNLTSVTISDGATGIGELAFYRCINLTDVTIPASLTNIGYRAFSSSAMKSIQVNTNNPVYSSLDGVLFNKDQTALILYPDDRNGSYTIPDSVTTISTSAFNECTGLSNVTFPDSVTTIEDNAFESCSSLTNTTLSSCITNIQSGAFRNCTGLTSLTIPSSLLNIGFYAFNSCTNLTNITFADGITTIGQGAFSDCTGLTNIIFPDSLISIVDYAFDDCSGLTSITLPDSMKNIGFAAFRRCTSLTDISLPDSITTIGEEAFAGCKSLNNITIPDNVTEIGKKAFAGCTSLMNTIIPDNFHSK